MTSRQPTTNNGPHAEVPAFDGLGSTHDLNASARRDPPFGEPRTWSYPFPGEPDILPRIRPAAHYQDPFLDPIVAPARGPSETLLFVVCGTGLVACIGLAVWLAFEQARECAL